MMRGALALSLLGFVWGCQDKEPVVGKSYLIEATGTRPAPEGPLVEVGRGEVPAKLSGPVRVAIDRDVPYPTAVAALKAVRAAGGEPAILVAVRDHVEALVPPDAKSGEAINLWADPDGQACIAPADSPTATCVTPKSSKHINRAFVRDIMAKAVREYGLKRVLVTVDNSLSWGDAVRAIDGARTCCGETAMEISVTPWW
jgi:hypothetical protein